MAKAPGKLIADNRKARFNYELLEPVEAGVALTGTEVKSLRDGKLNLGEGFCTFDHNGELWMRGVHISPYHHGTYANHEPTRPRKLLLHRGELLRLQQRVKERGLTIVPTRMYFKHGLAKVEVALARGRRKHDKRERIRERDVARDVAKQMA